MADVAAARLAGIWRKADEGVDLAIGEKFGLGCPRSVTHSISLAGSSPTKAAITLTEDGRPIAGRSGHAYVLAPQIENAPVMLSVGAQFEASRMDAGEHLHGLPASIKGRKSTAASISKSTSPSAAIAIPVIGT